MTVSLRKKMIELERAFAVSQEEMRRIIRQFHSQMRLGLAMRQSSLKMLPTYVDRPTGRERGGFIALDLGGTNFRVLELELKGSGRLGRVRSMKFAIPKDLMAGDGRRLFAFLAQSIKRFLTKENIDVQSMCGLGFTFSFPVKQEGIAKGRLIVWTKGFSAKGVIGKDVVGLLEEALRKEGLGSIRVSALANDTVGTLVARAYADKHCDIGVIIGTGTNACYTEATSRIKRLRRRDAKKTARMIVNIEWGNFNKPRLTSYDRQLDENSHNRGKQILEKMVSGMYLGEITRLVLLDLVGRGHLFSGAYAGKLGNPWTFKSEFMTGIQHDVSPGLSRTKRVLDSIGIDSTTLADRRAVQKICRLVTIRAARISAAAMAAVITKTDTELSKKHTVAIDGSVYEKNPDFSPAIIKALRELFSRKASRIRVVLSKDGSGIGAAIIAAVASSGA